MEGVLEMRYFPLIDEREKSQIEKDVEDTIELLKMLIETFSVKGQK